MTRPVAAAVVLALLSACGGGGGGDDDELQLSFATDDTTEAFSSVGETVRATTDDDGNITEITIGDNTFSGDAISENNADTDREDIVEMLRAVTAGEVTQDFMLDNETLDNAAFGLVADDQFTADAFAFGDQTPDQDIPTVGEATYSGRTIGSGTDDGVTQFAFTGDVRIHADFGTGEVSAALEDFETRGVNGAAPNIPDLSGSGFMTDGDFSVGLASEDKTGGIPDWLGTANGRLFGPAGEEAAGVWSAENDGQNIVVEGAFGAAQ